MMTCNYCDGEVFSTDVKPAMCRRHFEAALLVSRLERQGVAVTAENVLALKRRQRAPWAIADHEVMGLVKELSVERRT